MLILNFIVIHNIHIALKEYVNLFINPFPFMWTTYYLKFYDICIIIYPDFCRKKV